MQLSALAGTRYANHRRLAVPAEQFPRQKIFPVFSAPSLDRRCLLFHDILHGIKHLLVDDRRHTILDANLIVCVYADIPLIGQKPMERASSPRLSQLCANPPGIEIVRYDRIHFAAVYPMEYLADDGRGIFVDGILPVAALLVPEWQRGNHLALHRTVQQSTPDVLCHVLGVELVDVHHRAQGESAGSVVAELLLGVHDANTEPG